MSFCLPIDKATRFIEALKNGEIDPGKLADMNSEERRTFFKDIVGEEDAKEVNALFESKLLLKNQQAAMISWAKRVAGITPEIRRDMISRIEKMDNVLQPGDGHGFLADLAAKKLGTDVTMEEAKNIMDMSHEQQTAKAAIPADSPIGSPERLQYGAAQVALQNYLGELKNSNESTTLSEKMSDFKSNPAGGLKDAISYVSGLAKSLKASLDDSAIFHQGWKTLFTHPRIWADNAINSFKDIMSQTGKKADNNDIINAIKADIYSRPNALDGTYNKMKLSIGMGEEEFPTTLPEKIPLFGRLFKASEVAYNGFLMRMRADIADKYIEIAKNTNIDLTDKEQVRSIGRLVNSLTGRGELPFGLEKIGKTVNNVFFSPKMLKANFDFLTLHSTDEMSSFARKQAAINLVKVMGGMATIMAVSKVLSPNSVQLDPRSSDFGKIKIGDTRFDISGGMGSLITLAARILPTIDNGKLGFYSKSTTTGHVSPLNSGKFGSQDVSDVLVNFSENKLSPAAAILKDIWLHGKDFSGKKPTIGGETAGLLEPLPIQNVQEMLADPKSANVVLGTIMDALGITTNTYGTTKKK